MMTRVHGLQRGLVRLILAAVATQFVLAGAGAFGATSFQPHTAIGWVTAALCLIAVAVAALGRYELSASALLFAVVVVQVVLGVLGENASAWFGAVHGLNAVIVAGAAVNLAGRTQSLHRSINHTRIGAR
jgi:Family of unknown function (DUF6220)